MPRVEQSIRVQAPVEVVYRFWRNFENFPRFMEHVKDVRLLNPDGTLCHWVLEGPLGTQAEFDARITQDEANRSIGWSSVEGTVGSSGNVTFTETEHNTLVHAIVQWHDPPAGPIGELASTLLQDPERMLREDLERFKHVVEGSVAGPRR